MYRSVTLRLIVDIYYDMLGGLRGKLLFNPLPRSTLRLSVFDVPLN